MQLISRLLLPLLLFQIGLRLEAQTIVVCGANIESEQDWQALYAESSNKIGASKPFSMTIIHIENNNVNVKTLNTEANLSAIFAADGTKIIATSSNSQKNEGYLQTIDPTSAKELSKIVLKHFIPSFTWGHSTPVKSRNIYQIGQSDLYAVIGYEPDQQLGHIKFGKPGHQIVVPESAVPTVILCTSEKEIARLSLNQFPGDHITFLSNSGSESYILFKSDRASASSKYGMDIKYGAVRYDPKLAKLDFNEINLPDLLQEYFYCGINDVMYGLGTHGELVTLDPYGKPLNAVAFKDQLSEEYRPIIIGSMGDNLLLALIKYVGPGAVPTTKSQFAAFDVQAKTLKLGPLLDKPLMPGTIALTEAGNGTLFGVSDSKVIAYKLPSFESVVVTSLQLSHPYDLIISK